MSLVGPPPPPGGYPSAGGTDTATGAVRDPITGPPSPPTPPSPIFDTSHDAVMGTAVITPPPEPPPPSPPPPPIVNPDVISGVREEGGGVLPPPGPPPIVLPWDWEVIDTPGVFSPPLPDPPPGPGPVGPDYPWVTPGVFSPPPPPEPDPATHFWAWDRLESRSRQQDFTRILRAEIHDPLWMLGRQWQMGEFTGMDSGTGVLARAQVNYQKMNGISPFSDGYSGTVAATPYSSTDLPLEPIVEKINYNWSIKERILMGKKWLFFAKRRVGNTPYDDLLPWFRTADPTTSGTPFTDTFLLQVSEPTILSSDKEAIAGADIYSDKKVTNFLAAMSLSDNATLKEHDIDGALVFQFLETIGSITSLTGFPGGTVSAANVILAETDFKAWVKKMYAIPAAENWSSSGLEYKFDTFWPTVSSPLTETRISARDYHGGRFEWHTFVQDNLPPSVSGLTPSSPTSFFQQMVMTQNQFPGMPSSRWWEFEDGNVNFCNLDADPTDIAKVILTQFALIYQDDWFVIPCRLPVGSYADVRGVLVKDVFGVHTFISHYSRTKPIYGTGGLVTGFEAQIPSPPPASPPPAVPEWKSWRWLDISKKNDVVSGIYEPIGKLVIPPIVNKLHESKPIESVLFMRDEMADLVWGVENTVPDKLGRGKDGLDTVNNFLEYLKKIRGSADNNPPIPIDPTAKLAYQLEINPVPENWIPFTPVHAPVSPPGVNNRQIKYQRAAMPRIIDQYDNSLVRPRTEILNYGLRSVSTMSPPVPTGSILFPQSFGYPPQAYVPFYINEEEVPKGGTIVETNFKRTRWYNGRIINWIGRKRTMGKGGGNSGLAFDVVTKL